ncbi:flavocytochrome c [Natranaerobius trueperi]|uniref:Urocanate reductase n=1 Tax=Natranaerobius trueperi TaxID=759412 RepID=A0A226BYY3_9FIRM|nr:flavocytochrome c [Natranaerobius trueperi]OWZ83409.1 flavocytochrome c [Natranaerobius trueperi]
MKKISLLSIIISLVTLLAIVGCQPEEEDNDTSPTDENGTEVSEETSDVVIIGGGGAGMAAAVSAAEEGAEVVLIEKMPAIGGNTIISAGAYNAADPERQAEQGIEDSVDFHFEQTYEGGDEQGDEELVRTLVENSLDTKHWLEELGLEFEDEIDSVIGAMHERTHYPVAPSGTGYISVLEDTANELGVDIELETKAKQLIVEDDEVTGVIAEKDEDEIHYMAEDGVILATGGFSKNIEMRTEYDPELEEDIPSSNQPSATGEGILMAEEIGAELTNMDQIQILPIANEHGGLEGSTTINIENVVFVNQQGRRFVHEDARRDVLADAVFEQEGGYYYLINDSQIIEEENEYGESIDELIDAGSVKKGETLEELAREIDVPEEEFVETIENFNEAVEAREDEEFEREVFSNKIEEGPFYASIRYPSVHHTMGGVSINTDTQIISQEGDPIPGLYAAGEVTGNIHGTNRLGGNAIPDTMVFGRIAGQTVAGMEEGDEVLTGVGQGYGGNIEVEVHITDDEITQVEVIEHNETDRVSDPALEKIPYEIVKQNSTEDVDTVSGATDTSAGILEAVEDALE